MRLVTINIHEIKQYFLQKLLESCIIVNVINSYNGIVFITSNIATTTTTITTTTTTTNTTVTITITTSTTVTVIIKLYLKDSFFLILSINVEYISFY